MASSIPSSSSLTRKCPQPDTPVCIFAPPISSSETCSPITISAIRGEPEVHRRVAVAHDHDVAERRDVGAAGRARAEQHADLRDGARELDLVEEDAAGVAAAGEHLDLLGDPRAGRVDEVDHRHAVGERGLLDAEDLLDGLRAPRAGLDGRVVRHQRDGAAADRAHPGDDAVGAEPLGLPVGEQRVLAERAGVEQQRDALAHRQLALLGGLLLVALRPSGVGARERVLWRRSCAPT